MTDTDPGRYAQGAIMTDRSAHIYAMHLDDGRAYTPLFPMAVWFVMAVGGTIGHLTYTCTQCGAVTTEGTDKLGCGHWLRKSTHDLRRHT